MKIHYGSFKMRFTAGNFATDWHQLQIGIAVGCTISITWFILVMEVVVKAVNISEQIAHIHSLMEDVTILSTDNHIMQRALSRLDDL